MRRIYNNENKAPPADFRSNGPGLNSSILLGCAACRQRVFSVRAHLSSGRSFVVALCVEMTGCAVSQLLGWLASWCTVGCGALGNDLIISEL